MSRTVARLTGDTPFTDMMIALSPPGDIISFAGAVTATRVAFGQYVWRTTAATTAYTMVGAVSGVTSVLAYKTTISKHSVVPGPVVQTTCRSPGRRPTQPAT